MNQHYRGVEFLKKVTNPSYRIQERNNVFVSDFSNATDTLNQKFQCMVIRDLFSEEYADFWRFISKLPKKFLHPKDNSLEDYTQMTGQPQGLLASFDSFSLAHIILICMLMKRFNLEDRYLKDTLAIVGDDSVVSYPCELELQENTDFTFYTFHSWLCKEVSLIKNDSKTGKSFFESENEFSHEILDFAKISIMDGLNLTPIPYGLCSQYSLEHGKTDLQLIFWLNSKGLTYKRLAYRRLFQAFYKTPYQLMAVSSVMSSGEIPFLEKFKDEVLYSSIDSSIRGLSMFMFYLNQLEHTFLSSILSESQKELLDTDNFLSKGLKSLEGEFLKFSERSLERLLSLISNTNHKYDIMVNKNIQLAMDLQDVLDYQGDDESLSLLLGVLINEDYQSLFRYSINLWREIQRCIKEDSQSIWEMFCFQDFSFFRDLVDPLKNYQIKSMKRLSSKTVTLFRPFARKEVEFVKHSSYLDECMKDSVSEFTDTILEITGYND